MEGRDELNEIDIKNCTCYHFEDMNRNRDIYSVDILLDEKIYENVSVYDILYKTSMGPKPLHIRFDKIDGFLIILGCKTKHLVLFDYGLLDYGYGFFDCEYDKIKYLTSEKSGITDSINHNFGKIRIVSYNSLPIQKILTFHNVIILIQSVLNKNETQYYYNTLLAKGLYKDKSDTTYF